jgi:uncharacterized membrane protein (UPF0127 family)
LLDQECWSDTDGVFWWLSVHYSEAMAAPKIPTSLAFITADGVILTVVDVATCERDGCAPPTGTSVVMQVRQGLFTSHAVKPGDLIYAYGGDHLVPLNHMPSGG